MLLELHQKRDALHPGALETDTGSSIYHRLRAGEGAFKFDHVTVGFVLNRSPRHEGAFGKPDFVRMPLEPGMGWVLPAGLDGKARWAQDLDFINVHFSADALRRVNGGELPEFGTREQVMDPALVQLTLNLHETAKSDGSVVKMYRDTMMLALAAHVNRSYARSFIEPPAPTVDSRIKRAIDFVEQNLDQNVSLERLADIAAMSPFHFARSFKKATGMPPHQFLASRRIERAKHLLKMTGLPIVEVAFRVGYENVSHFTQLFRRMTGGTPGQFRTA